MQTNQSTTNAGAAKAAQIKTATLISDNLPDFNGHAAHYRLSVPLGKSYDEDFKPVSDVVVSAVTGWAHETYIFPADENGKVTAWGELPGSIKGTTSHEEALKEAGYAIA